MVAQTSLVADAAYSYSDGGGNAYTIRPDAITFEPVKPETSSSGVYDGGQAGTVKLTPEEFKTIGAIIDQLARDKSAHAAERRMGMGLLTIHAGGKNQTIVIDDRAPDKAKLEALLQAKFGK